MKKLFALFAVLSSTSAFAASTSYRISSQIYVNGKLVASPRIITDSDAQVTEVSDSGEKLSLKVDASDASNEKIQDGILMKFELQYMAGNKTIKANPQIIAKPGTESTVIIGQNQAQEEVMLKVTASRE